MATARRPASAISASRACNSGASGVVKEPVRVPTTPVDQPARSRMAASR